MSPPSTSELEPGETTAFTSYKSRLIAEHVVAQLEEHRKARIDDHPLKPLMVALQGPQGGGKTTVTSALKILLESDIYGLHVAVISLDDFYLDHTGLVEVAKANSGNHLLAGRGLAGTHDLPFGKATLSQLQSINDVPDRTVVIPSFDKSLHGGEGDRAASYSVNGPLDVVFFEGWSMGFAPLPADVLEKRYQNALSLPTSDRPVYASHPLEHLLVVNRNLVAEADALYPFFTVFIQLSVSSLSHIYTWRLQQEHTMMAQNGGKGMNADQVRAFVDRYLPAYELWGDGISQGKWSEQWRGRGLDMSLDSERKIVDLKRF